MYIPDIDLRTHGMEKGFIERIIFKEKKPEDLIQNALKDRKKQLHLFTHHVIPYLHGYYLGKYNN